MINYYNFKLKSTIHPEGETNLEVIRTVLEGNITENHQCQPEGDATGKVEGPPMSYEYIILEPWIFVRTCEEYHQQDTEILISHGDNESH